MKTASIIEKFRTDIDRKGKHVWIDSYPEHGTGYDCSECAQCGVRYLTDVAIRYHDSESCPCAPGNFSVYFWEGTRTEGRWLVIGPVGKEEAVQFVKTLNSQGKVAHYTTTKTLYSIGLPDDAPPENQFKSLESPTRQK